MRAADRGRGSAAPQMLILLAFAVVAMGTRIELRQQHSDELANQLRECFTSNVTISNRTMMMSSYKLADDREKRKSIKMGVQAATGPAKHSACHVALRSAAFMPFIGRIQLGEPGQMLEALFDTGSDTLWVKHSRCQMNGEPWPTVASDASGGRKTASRTVRGFASDKSRTFRRLGRERVSLSRRLGAGVHSVQLNGWWVTEIVHLEDLRDQTRSVSVADQAVGLICNVVGPEEHLDDLTSEFSAIVGLSFPHNESAQVNTFLENLFTKKLQVDGQEVFSFYTARRPNKPGRQTTGELIIGQIDPKLFVPPIVWAPVARRPLWQIHLESIRLLERETPRAGAESPLGQACPHGCQAVVDTGSGSIVGPDEQVAALNKQLDFERNELGVYYAPGACAKHRRSKRALVFGIHNSHLELEPEAYLLDVDAAPGIKLCVSALRGGGPEQTNWVLGAPFIANFYTIFDYNRARVGFAQPVNLS